jgi:hypothetical protein
MERMVSGNKLLLVGSIPLDTPEQVFQSFGAPLGRHLSAMPDGEVGPRRHWISRVHYQVLAARVYLGAIHNMTRFKERIATARKYLPEFGLGAYCGFGREPVSALPRILGDHLDALAIAAKA